MLLAKEKLGFPALVRNECFPTLDNLRRSPYVAPSIIQILSVRTTGEFSGVEG